MGNFHDSYLAIFFYDFPHTLVNNRGKNEEYHYLKKSFAFFRMKSQERKKLITEYMGADDSHKIQMEKRYGKKQLQTMVDMFMSEKYLCENTKPCPK